MADNPLTKRLHGVRAYWDDRVDGETWWNDRIVFPTRQEAEAWVAREARMAGATSQARVVDEYDPNYLMDSVVVQWITPVWSEQPKDIFIPDRRFEGSPIQPRVKITRRLGDIPQ